MGDCSTQQVQQSKSCGLQTWFLCMASCRYLVSKLRNPENFDMHNLNKESQCAAISTPKEISL